MFVIENPDVFKSTSDTYVVFGATKVEDLNAAVRQQAMQKMAAAQAAEARLLLLFFFFILLTKSLTRHLA